MSMPVYIWRESALIISPSKSEASATANAVLPLAVGPVITGYFIVSRSKISRVSLYYIEVSPD